MRTLAANLIRYARVRARLSQRQLAELAHTSQSAIASYESGRKSPSVETLERIVQAAGFDLRVRLSPHDDRDEWLARLEESLPQAERDPFQAEQREVIDRARRRSR